MRTLRLQLAVGVIVTLLATVILMSSPSPASADGGPHGGYTATGGSGGGLPDQCAACHRVHQGKSVGKLLKATSPYALCLTCHNGTGSVLDVLDGKKLAGLATENASVVRSVDTTSLNISVAPSAVHSMPAGKSAKFTLAVRNRTDSPVTVSLAITNETNIDVTTGKFNASSLSAASVLVAAKSGSIPGVAYVTLTTTAKVAAVATDTNLTTITATLGAETGDIVVQSTVGASAATTLNGGGFLFVGGLEITSRHNADPADNTLRPWGYNLLNTGQRSSTDSGGNALASPLQCTSCHNPHGTANYRLLKESVNGQTVNVKAYYGGALTKDEGARGLESGAPADKYVKDYYGSSGDAALGGKGNPGVASLCGACHTAYPSDGASTGYTAGGATHYRHKTEMPFSDWSNPDTARVSQNPATNPVTGFPALRLASNTTQTRTVVTCLTCHRVHGTSTTMSGYALMLQNGGLGDNDLTPSQAPAWDATSTSTLLFTDNRGMCQACHQWGVTD